MKVYCYSMFEDLKSSELRFIFHFIENYFIDNTLKYGGEPILVNRDIVLPVINS